jgi:hypothetical protein
VLGGIVKGGMMAAGVAKVAYGGFKRAASAGSSTGRLGSSIKSLFGVGKTPVRARPQHDFTPREEELEGGGVKDVLERIEANTAALLEKFGGKPGDGKGGGLLSGLSGLISGLGSSLVSILKGPAMIAAVAALGTALAVAFGDKALEVLCKKFPSLCGEGLIPSNAARIPEGGILSRGSHYERSLSEKLGLTGGNTELNPDAYDFGIIAKHAEGGDLAKVNKDRGGTFSTGPWQLNSTGGIPALEKLIESDEQYAPLKNIMSGKFKSHEALQGAIDEVHKDPKLVKLLESAQADVANKSYVSPAMDLGKEFGLKTNDRGIAELLFSGILPSEALLRKSLKNAKELAASEGNVLADLDAGNQFDYIMRGMDIRNAAAPDSGYTPHRMSAMSEAKSFLGNPLMVTKDQKNVKVQKKVKEARTDKSLPASTENMSLPRETYEAYLLRKGANLIGVETKAPGHVIPYETWSEWDTSISSKPAQSKSPSLTAPPSPTSSSEGKGNTTVINNVPQQQGGGSKTRPSHRSPDVSIEKQLMEDKIHSSTR